MLSHDKLAMLAFLLLIMRQTNISQSHDVTSSSSFSSIYKPTSHSQTSTPRDMHSGNYGRNFLHIFLNLQRIRCLYSYEGIQNLPTVWPLVWETSLRDLVLQKHILCKQVLYTTSETTLKLRPFPGAFWDISMQGTTMVLQYESHPWKRQNGLFESENMNTWWLWAEVQLSS